MYIQLLKNDVNRVQHSTMWVLLSLYIHIRSDYTILLKVTCLTEIILKGLTKFKVKA